MRRLASNQVRNQPLKKPEVARGNRAAETMPSRMIDYPALWTSNTLALCSESVRLLYAWCYGLADANGSFELDMRAIHGQVSVIVPRLTRRRIEKAFAEFEKVGLLFTWQENGKTYGHWTKSDLPGRLPKFSERGRYKKFAPPVPQKELGDYMSRQHRDRGASMSQTGVGVGVGVVLNLIGERNRDGAAAEPPQVLGLEDPKATSTATPPFIDKTKIQLQENCTPTACHKCGRMIPASEYADHWSNCSGAMLRASGS